MQHKKRSDGSRPECLFRCKHGVVNAEVWGFRIGFRSLRISYYRWVPSSKEPGKWEKRPPDREDDQLHLEKCVKAVRAWQQERFATKPLGG